MGLASTLPIDITKEDENIESIIFSQNGYHVAITTSSSYQITIYDLRKVKCIATIPTEGLVVYGSMSFDNSGKYLAFATTSSSSSGNRTITIIFVKDQSMISTISTTLEYDISSLVWSDVVGKCLVTGCKNDDRFVRFFGIDEKMDE